MKGYGSCLNEDGDIEMDALIMDGASMNCGAIGSVSNVKNPVHLARYIMTMSKEMIEILPMNQIIQWTMLQHFFEKHNLRTHFQACYGKY